MTIFTSDYSHALRSQEIDSRDPSCLSNLFSGYRSVSLGVFEDVQDGSSSWMFAYRLDICATDRIAGWWRIGLGPDREVAQS
jgi:hypothetical protein